MKTFKRYMYNRSHIKCIFLESELGKECIDFKMFFSFFVNNIFFDRRLKNFKNQVTQFWFIDVFTCLLVFLVFVIMCYQQ